MAEVLLEALQSSHLASFYILQTYLSTFEMFIDHIHRYGHLRLYSLVLYILLMKHYISDYSYFEVFNIIYRIY